MTRIFDGGVPAKRPKAPAGVFNITIGGKAAVDLFRHYLGEGSTAADVVAALGLAIRAMEADAGAEMDVMLRQWDLRTLPLFTAGMAPPNAPSQPPPRWCG